jgi:hypothetical protein
VLIGERSDDDSRNVRIGANESDLSRLGVDLEVNRSISQNYIEGGKTMKQIVKTTVLVAGFILAMTLMSGVQGEQQGKDIDRVARGYAIAPVPLNLEGKDPVLVGLGSYLVNAGGGCNDCHTNPSYAEGGDPFFGQPKRVNAANYLAGGVQFGPFVSRNITPDPESGKPAGHTFDEFLLILRTGIDLDQAHPQFGPLLQVMPWPVYGDLSDHDIRAIYEYLTAIPHAKPRAQ